MNFEIRKKFIEMRKVMIMLFLVLVAACSPKENHNAIKGLEPVDVYLNMEKKGFQTKETHDQEFGHSWDNTMTTGGIEFVVNTFSNDMSSVESIRATAMVSEAPRLNDAMDFFAYVASLPYDGSNPAEAMKWVAENYGSEEASTVIGDARFTLKSPSQFIKILMIEKNR